ncbi:MAG TPA: EamA family transporter [Herpetosiphonaceae bacterium]|nr:EamA family transporter [Herpetosiphonaceae bacterium]
MAITPSGSRRGPGLILIAALLWGTVGVASKTLSTVAHTTALSTGFWRLAIAAPVLLAACWRACGRRSLRIPPRDLGLMLLIGATMAAYQVCFFAAIDRVGVTSAVLVTLCTAPIIVAVLAAGLLGEAPTAGVMLALAGGLLGTALLVWPGAGAAGTGSLAGIALALASALGYSIMTLCSRALAGRYHPLQPMAVGFVAGALLLLPFALASGLVASYPLAGWALLLHLGLVPTALAFVLFLAGMRTTTATVASVITLVEPLTGAALAWLLFGERLGPFGWLGAALLLGALASIYRGARRAEPGTAAAEPE